MKWIKLGNIFDPENRKDWMQSYAQNPNAVVLEDRIRVYFTCRPKPDADHKFVSRIGYADFQKDEPTKLISVSENPVLELGGPGDFDEFGTMPGSIIHIPEMDEYWLYYVGWTRMHSVPYKWSNGLAVSKDGGVTFQKPYKGPIMGSTSHDPYLQACPRVYRLNDRQWVMYYQSGTAWNKVGEKFESVYITRKAYSENGIQWRPDHSEFVPSVVENECQTSGTYFKHKNQHHFYFSYRHGIDFRSKERGYRIGYMYSENGETWTRDDAKAGIDISYDGWDSEMVCYPGVFELDGQVYMLYCGNHFGRHGFGLARLEED